MSPYVEVSSLCKHFQTTSGFLSRQTVTVKAVDGVGFTIERGKTLGLVGESGCGKSTTGRVMVRLYPQTSGEFHLGGEDVFSLHGRELRRKRHEMQYIFQDPYSSLNPTMTVGDIIGEPLLANRVGSKAERRERVKSLMDRVGLSPYHVRRYPHEFSGGQRQRIGIARALALEPGFIIADEAVSALDVSIQAQIINLFQDIQQEFGLTYLFIAHDLSVVRHISDRIAVMYLGRIVEIADEPALFNTPRHPYTRALLQAAPVPDPEHRAQRQVLQGDVPNPANPPSGCAFRTRCPNAVTRCAEAGPELQEVSSNHFVACLRASEI